jgi:dTDP-4-dehydrorhamnose reductase
MSSATSRPLLTVGADGLIGAALEARLRAEGGNVIATTRRPSPPPGRIRLDLADAPERWQLPDVCGVTWLLAGMTSLAQCEADPELTRRINVDHTLALARMMGDRGSHIVFVSTNLVTSGTLPDVPLTAEIAPQCEYGRQKADVERALLESGLSASILRITKVAETLGPLLRSWALELTQGRPIAPFSDLVCAPIRLADVIDALTRLGELRMTGLFHVGARPDLRYDQIAGALAAKLGVSSDLVHPTTSTVAGVTLLARSRFTTLQTDASEAQLGLPPCSADVALDHMLAEVAHYFRS